MDFKGFTNEDFNVFTIEGLDARMEALKETIRPKLEALGEHFSPTLSTIVGEEMFFHVAKHARRSVNPPKDTWVAFANNKRGYKMVPHFQIGLWETHLFIWFAVIYEANGKEMFGKSLEKNITKINELIPSDFVWSMDHTKPEVISNQGLSQDDLLSMFTRLQTVKKAEILCGITIDRNTAVEMTSDQFIQKVDDTFKQLIPLYQLSSNSK
ncbi:DUF1054 domain-containing protein [Bacillus luteolus]|uniref:UPF0637 protein IMZ08_12520 n=1 Tax=Litchfieldia luteola TaxID=682179 RepID=A0ABR9QK58_9BACI|nr:DUF1054 domain-containing protein [Cytobacillus luteolus]MBE4908884.1 DUF1054 domain-containing protein [Cytobacillus luteolus]MBP1941742.1 uncharacterized protein YktB (UPF0637 family) [Cytobacillus luteolus]